MQRMQSLLARLRPVVLTAAVLCAACQPAAPPGTGPRPVSSAPAIVPAPASMTLASSAPFNLARTSSIVVDAGNPEVTAIAEILAAQIRKSTQFPMVVTTTAAAPASIALRLGGPASLGDEGYSLTVTSDSVRLTANRPAGLFHGIQTIRQLLPADVESDMGSERSQWEIPALTITDFP